MTTAPETSHLTDVGVDKTSVIHSLEHDQRFFIDFFLHQELSVPIPDFHCTIFQRMTHTESSYFALAVPRAHAKTTLAKLTCIWYWLFTDFSFIVYVSNTHDIAAACVKDVIEFMTGDNFRQVFGELRFHIQRESEGYYEFNVGKKRCIIKARGVTQQLRGTNVGNKRPQLAICDDLEDESNTNTPPLVEKMKKWFFGAFLKCLDQFKHKLIYIGTVRGRNTLLINILSDPDYKSIRLGAILSNGSPLWPDLWSIERLKIDFAKYVRNGMIHVWMAEMMNLVVPQGKGLIEAEKIGYLPAALPGSIEYGFICVDPAFSREKWANASSITVHGWIAESYVWQLVEDVTIVGMDPTTMFNTIIDLCFKWGISVVGIEAVAAQKVLRPVFEIFCEQNGITNIVFIDLMASSKKSQRIAAWATMLGLGQYALRHDDVRTTQALLNYDPTKEDMEDEDLIDSAAYSVQMIELHSYLIMNQSPALQPSHAGHAGQRGQGLAIENLLLEAM